MPGPYRVTPDRDFLHRVLEDGGDDLKKCFQCATCSVVCELSDGNRPFPRKEMIWTQWGLKDRLMADPDVWLCHQCGDCSTQCPRGARPGDVLAAIRREAISHYAVPASLARWVNDPARLLPVLLVPAVLLVLAMLLGGPLGRALGIEPETTVGGHWEYSHMFPHWLLIVFFTFFWGVAIAAVGVGVVRFWNAMQAADAGDPGVRPAKPLLTTIVDVAKDFLLHDRFAQCTAHRPRYLAHLGVFYGFLGLLIVTVWAVAVLYILKPLFPGTFVYPFGFWNPMKVLANLSTVALIVGCVLMIRDRMSMAEEAGVSTRFDWAFLWLLTAVASTGLIVELLRFADVKSLGYMIYFVHLVLVFSLLVYLPYSKFAHMLYRTAALVYSEYSGRNESRAQETPEVV
jgi:quinone-modifying oxidoreductase subunit QmoC